MDGKDFVGTITPTEARKVILEEVLGSAQEDLAGITIGFNRGRIITYVITYLQLQFYLNNVSLIM